MVKNEISKPRIIAICGSEISNKTRVYFDLDDYDLVAQYDWYVHTQGYVRASIYNRETKR